MSKSFTVNANKPSFVVFPHPHNPLKGVSVSRAADNTLIVNTGKGSKGCDPSGDIFEKDDPIEVAEIVSEYAVNRRLVPSIK